MNKYYNGNFLYNKYEIFLEVIFEILFYKILNYKLISNKYIVINEDSTFDSLNPIFDYVFDLYNYYGIFNLVIKLDLYCFQIFNYTN